MTTTNILPWEDIIICTEAPEEKTAQGVIIGGGSNYDEKQRPEKGIVYAIGKSSEKDKKLPVDLKVGDLVFYERYTANKISHGGIQYNFIRFKNIMGAVPQKEGTK